MTSLKFYWQILAMLFFRNKPFRSAYQTDVSAKFFLSLRNVNGTTCRNSEDVKGTRNKVFLWDRKLQEKGD
jgi:hypothetical protein